MSKRVWLTVLLLLAGALAQESKPVEVTLEAYLVTEVTAQDGTVEETFTEATEARPGQTVEYRVTVSNNSEETLPVGTVVVTGPVPGSTFYLAGTAGTAADASETFKTEFSADGGESFSELPVMITVTNDSGDEEEVVADPADFSAVRWTLLEALAPDATRTFTYRVEVK